VPLIDVTEFAVRLAGAPAVVVAVMLIGATAPAVALSVFEPARVPSVHWVVASPFTSVFGDVGDIDPPPPVTRNTTA
jgi:hypothetical protein